MKKLWPILLSFFLILSYSISVLSFDKDMGTPVSKDTQVNLIMDYPELNETCFSSSFDLSTQKILNDTLDGIMAKAKYTGLSVAVYAPGRGSWAACRTLDSRINLSEKTRLHAGSIGKMFAVTVIFRLIEEGKLSLNMNISTWFPTFPQAQTITVQQLLEHTSGIVSFDFLTEYDRFSYIKPEDLVGLARGKGLLFRPGSRFSYSNTGYVMLGLIVEKVTGLTYQQAVEQYIIKKLKLEDTVFITKDNEQLLAGYHQGIPLGKRENYANPFSAGPIMTTPKDLVIFYDALLKGDLIKDSSLSSMVTEMNYDGTLSSIRNYYGKGIILIKNTPVGDFLGHSGGINGFRAALYYQPKTNFIACAMTNDDYTTIDIEAAAFRLIDCFKNR